MLIQPSKAQLCKALESFTLIENKIQFLNRDEWLER